VLLLKMELKRKKSIKNKSEIFTCGWSFRCC
jgi:hypothetical protein